MKEQRIANNELVVNEIKQVALWLNLSVKELASIASDLYFNAINIEKCNCIIEKMIQEINELIKVVKDKSIELILRRALVELQEIVAKLEVKN